jgi:hypothetical protein
MCEQQARKKEENMIKTRLIGAATLAVLVIVGCGKKDGSDDAPKTDSKPVVKVERSAEQDRLDKILDLAEKSVEEDVNVNFYGFFTGMSRYDADYLAAHYKLKKEDYSLEALPGKAVSRLWISLMGVRSITNGGNSLEELAKVVSTRMGALKKNLRTGEYEYKTINGIVVTFSDKGLTIQNDGVAQKKSIATEIAAQKDQADVDAAIAEQEAVIKKTKDAVQSIIGDMVAIPGKSFKMGKYEVTQKQWVALMGNNPSSFKGDDNPVNRVTWKDCKAFLEKLNAMPEVKVARLTFRLPTGAEWDYACRAGGTGEYCRLADGTEINESTLGKVAWFDKTSGETTHPVGQKMANAFGLFDMHGNVSEWCDDIRDDGLSRICRRGGGRPNLSSLCQTGNRDNYIPEQPDWAIGFRLLATQK